MGESRAVLSLATILSFRMLGLFMIYPVFAVYAPSFKYATPALVGVALGIYGLTQGILQLPLSALSDNIGRKSVIIGGLLAFASGSIISALTHNIYILILGRALQGSGAIGSTLMASAADLTSLENRTKAMAVLGMTIGISFACAMVIGPVINNWFHLSGIFWLTALFAMLGILIHHLFVPTAPKQLPISSSRSLPKLIVELLHQSEVLKLNLSIFLLHALFTASFVVVPLLLVNIGIPSVTQWKTYLPTLIGAFVISLPVLIIAEKKKMVKQSLLGGIFLIGVGEILFYNFPHSHTAIMTALFTFFTGFTLLEALLPSLISKYAPSNHKGTVMGIFSSFQFFGIFIGGMAAGLMQTHYSQSSIFFYSLLICSVWLLFIAFMRPPAVFKEIMIRLNQAFSTNNTHTIVEKLLTVPGVLEATFSPEDGIAYLKVDNKILDYDLLNNLSTRKSG